MRDKIRDLERNGIEEELRGTEIKDSSGQKEVEKERESDKLRERRDRENKPQAGREREKEK